MITMIECGCTGCTNKATHKWSGHPTCDECATPTRQAKREAILKLPEKQKEVTYVVSLPEFHVTATNPNDAATQACQTFIDYPSSRECSVREVGTQDDQPCFPDTLK